MIIKKAYKFKPELKGEIREKFSRCARCCRFIFNYELVKLKKELLCLKEAHSHILQQSLKEWGFAFQQLFRWVKNKETSRFPQFKQKGNQDSFRYPQRVQVEGI